MKALKLLVIALFIYGCSGSVKNNTIDTVVITIDDSTLSFTIDENSVKGTNVGTLKASVTPTGTDLKYEISSQNPNTALSIDSATGALSVENASSFDFEQRTSVTADIKVSAGSVNKTASITVKINDVDENDNTPTPTPTQTIWSGTKMTFTKANNADPATEAAQDRITDKVWITRGNSGGEIYNAVSENQSSKNVSPAGTEWAQGTTSNISTLTFASFRTASGGKPKDVLGKDMVLHLIADDIYIDIKIISFAQRKTSGGGFSYERSTKN